MDINPILNKYNTKYESIPFSSIKSEHIMPAINTGLQEAYKNIENIKKNTETPTFKNVITLLDSSTQLLDKVTNVYFNLYSLESNTEFKELSNEISPKLAKLSGDIYTDNDLFLKVKKVYEQKKSYSGEELRLLEITYKSFTRNGALLSDEKKDLLKEIDKELSLLSPKFSKNCLDATNDFELIITDINKLKGLPDNALEAASHFANKKGLKDSWLFNLQMPSYLPVMQYAENRDLRKKISTAYGVKNLNNKFDNRDVILKTIELKDKRAKLLGYSNHAEYVLEKRMANNANNVFQFLDSLYDVVYPHAKKELDEVKQLAKKIDNIDDFQSWDFAYYSQKLKKQKFNFDQEVLRPYLKAENVIDGIFQVANKMYGLKFTEINDVDIYHPDVKTYEVSDKNNYIGLFYVDLYPRETKQSGAWMNTLKVQGLDDGEIKRPHVIISGNLTPSTPTKPSLLSFDEARTIFHEFGHALHGLLSDVTFPSLASPNVFWDFVELPSQIMENWLLEKETLEIFAKHYETNEIMPIDLINKIKETQTFNAASIANRQLSLGYLDMNWHTTDPSLIKDVVKFENEINEKTRLLPITEGNTSTGFSHIFAGGYSSGYYSYKWAEVLDADAFEFFKENGIFNKDIAKSFRDNILSKGNTEDPMDLYIKFRGKEPDPKALLRRDGLI